MEEREREVGRPLELMEVASDKQNNPSFVPYSSSPGPIIPSSLAAIAAVVFHILRVVLTLQSYWTLSQNT